MQSLHVQTRDLRMHYLQAGTGDPVILLHGFPQTSHEWRHQIAALSEEHAVFAPDTRGFGGTDKPNIRVSRDLLARDIINFMDALGIGQATLVGHDWGGIIAFKTAIEYPERFSRLALIDTLCTVWIPWGFHGYWFKAEPLPEQFFAKYHKPFIEAIFAGAPPPYGGFPETPWGGRGPRPANPGRPAWVDPEDADHYVAAFADPGAHFHAIQYYRYALPFHIVTPEPSAPHGERYESLSEPRVAEMWRHPGGLDQSPLWQDNWMDYGPEDRHKRFEKPVLWMYCPYLVPGAWKDGPPPFDHIPTGNPYVDQFSRYFPDLRARPTATGHFIPEEAPQATNEALLGFIAGKL